MYLNPLNVRAFLAVLCNFLKSTAIFELRQSKASSFAFVREKSDDFSGGVGDA
jgi:hypothetical protein